MRFLIAPVLLAVLTAGCTSEVTGSGTGSETKSSPATTSGQQTPTPSATKQNGTTALDGVPPEHYEGLPAQYCDKPFTGALGKPMLAVVMETPKGRLNCDQAGAVLFDYYAERREPKTGLPPVEIGTLSCNQVAEGAMPQVVCADTENVIYSMWPQT
ncbi:hypothetical protein [Lentzea sp.]|uniref:hypothetical protein n=1 Tax=Lentzea sp. TaxID=56099 RepID=UPI002ED2ED93